MHARRNAGFNGRYSLLDDAGPDTVVPGIAPFLEVKAPTADADKGLPDGAPPF